MPIIKSAKKQLRQSLVKRTRNYKTRAKLKEALKEIQTIAKENSKEAPKKLQETYKIIDTATKKGIIHANKASHLKSQMAKLLNKTHTEKPSETPSKKAPKSKTKKGK